jgi:Tol biopolymer transport system component/DNA-binding winged helix-turn-helix (wHTH) protein
MRPAENSPIERGGHYTGRESEVLPVRGIFSELFLNAFMSSGDSHLYEFGPFVLNPSEQVLLRGGQPVPLRPKVYDLLVVLVGRPNHLFRKRELMDALWPGEAVEEGNLDKNISMLRRALGGGGARYIETVPRRGYRFNAEVRAVATDGAETELVVETQTRVSLVVEEESDDGPAPEVQALTSAQTGNALRVAAATPPRRLFRWLAPAAVLLLLLAGVIAWRLGRADHPWRNPLAGAQFTLLTDFPGAEWDAVVSRDGKSVAFLSDRGGPLDVWVGHIDTGEFQNLTKGQAPDIGNPRVRNLSFSPEGSQVAVEVRLEGRVYTWAAPTMGGPVRPYADGVELAWSPDGTRLAYHTDGPGDPIFVSVPGEKIGKQIYAAELGVHCHHLAWSPDGAFIYFVRGFPPDEMDVWRVRPTGGTAERVTFHNSRVSHLTFLNARTLLYIARAEDGTGPWLYGVDVERRVPQRISFGVERYTSVAASADGRRLVATVANPDANLWRVPITDGAVEEPAAQRVPLPTTRGVSPRIGPGYLLYLSSKGGNDGLWKYADQTSVELWGASLGRVFEGAAISPDGRRVAFTAQKAGRNRLYLMNPNGTGLVELADSLSIRGAPAWPPSGEWVTVAAAQGGGEGLFKVPLDGGEPVRLVGEKAANPVWSPDGSFLVYSGVEVGTTIHLKAVTAHGEPYAIPELILARGANRFTFIPGRPVLVVLKGDVWHKNFWSVDLVTGEQRQLTNFSREFLISDFDISPDGREIIFSRQKENANVIMIDLPEFR